MRLDPLDTTVTAELERQGFNPRQQVPVPEGYMSPVPIRHPFFSVHFDACCSLLLSSFLCNLQCQLYGPAELFHVFHVVEYVAAYRINNANIACRPAGSPGGVASGPGYSKKEMHPLKPKVLQQYLATPQKKPPPLRDIALCQVIAPLARGISTMILAFTRAGIDVPRLRFSDAPELKEAWYRNRFFLFERIVHPTLPQLADAEAKAAAALTQAPAKLVGEASTSFKAARAAADHYISIYPVSEAARTASLNSCSEGFARCAQVPLLDTLGARVATLAKLAAANTANMLPAMKEPIAGAPTRGMRVDWSLDPCFPVLSAVAAPAKSPAISQ